VRTRIEEGVMVEEELFPRGVEITERYSQDVWYRQDYDLGSQ
jgi:hypothetical protein